MLDISKIDKNFKIESCINKDDIRYYSIDDKPFNIHGIFKENGKYRRLPEKVARNISEGVYNLHTNTAGGRVRFKTNSSYVAIYVKMNSIGKMSHFALTGSAGFDLYVKEYFMKTFIPPFNVKNSYESIIEFENNALREITINFPLYSGVNEMFIGVQKEAVLEEAKPYTIEKPIVYYGSSITQGGCASRPGMSYPSIISRKFDCDYVNLGFSGSAKAEKGIIEYIRNLDMSLFVYDYDHNSPNIEHLKATHEKMFESIRCEKPYTPIIIMSRPKYFLTEEEEVRKSITETTYKNARLKGDKKVYFLSGKDLTEYCKNEGTVDNCHPTDFGFFSISEAIGKLIEHNSLI